MRTTKLLLIQPFPGDADVLAEAIEESAPHLAAVRAETLADALPMMFENPPDVVLLDPNLPDSRQSWSFLSVHATLPNMPVVLVVGKEDEALAKRLLREGAQDYVLKHEIDAEPLRRALQNAIERQKVLDAARADAVIDQPTGLLNSNGFFLQAEMLRQVALRFGARLHLHFAESGDSHPEQRNLKLMELSDRLRKTYGLLTVIARVSEDRLAALTVDQPQGAGGVALDAREPVLLELAASAAR